MSRPDSLPTTTGFVEGWVRCGCCAGLEWGGETPRECRDCDGNGFQYRYASGRLALYPGGPLKGQEHPDYQRKVAQHGS